MSTLLSVQEIKTLLAKEAAQLGFEAFGVTSIEVSLRHEYFEKWISEGKHGEMSWMDNMRRLDPKAVLPEAKSILCLGMNYRQEVPEKRYRIAQYALGSDYHKIILKKLKRLCLLMREHGGIQKPYVDTGPILEKPIAAQAGLGWQGKSTVLIHSKQGPWLFLGVILTTLELPPDAPQKDHCGKCTACIDVCPTQAITAPYQLDSRRCLSYLTIEHKGSIPEAFREALGNRVYGCDECLEVCPWNRWARTTRELKFLAKDYPDLREMLSWNEEDFDEHFQGTPIKRLKLSRWLRNVCVVLGNIGNKEDLPGLKKLSHREDPLIKEHALWAIDKIKKRCQ